MMGLSVLLLLLLILAHYYSSFGFGDVTIVDIKLVGRVSDQRADGSGCVADVGEECSAMT